MKTVRIEITQDDLGALYGALAEQHNRLIAERRDPAMQNRINVIDRQLTRCLDVLVKVERKIGNTFA